MAQQHLYQVHIGTCFQQMSGITMPQYMHAHFLYNAHRLPGPGKYLLHAALTVMITMYLAVKQKTLWLVLCLILPQKCQHHRAKRYHAENLSLYLTDLFIAFSKG